MGYKLQNVCEKDRDLLFKWANDEMCRKNSFNSRKISYKEHCEWFDKKMRDPLCCMFIYYYEEEPVGQIRIDCDGEEGRVSYFVAGEYRGQGHGKNMLRLAEHEMKGKIKKIVSYVKNDNIASQYVFLNNNYNEEIKDDFIKYEKVISNVEDDYTEFVLGG